MRKTIILLLALVLICALTVSCRSTSTYYDMTQMLPEFSVGWDDLDRDQYEFIGNVTGSSTFTIAVEEGEDTEYVFTGILDLNNPDEIFKNSDIRDALDIAVYEMTQKAKALNANFLILPSYSVEAKEEISSGLLLKTSFTNEVTVSVSAVAVKLINSNGQSLEVY